MSGESGTWWRGRPLTAVLAIGAIGAAVGLAFTLVRPVSYESESQVVIRSASSSSLFQTSQDSPSDRSLETQAQLFSSDNVVSAVAKQTGLTTGDVRSSVAAEVATGSEVIVVRASRPNAGEAQEVLQSVVNNFVAVNRRAIIAELRRQARALTPIIRELSDQIAASEDQLPASTDALASLQEQRGQFRAAARSETGAAQVITAPTRPTTPSSISRSVAVALGGAIGAALGLGLALGLRGRWAGSDEGAPPTPISRRA